MSLISQKFSALAVGIAVCISASVRLHAQQASETVNMKQYPLKFDKTLGAAAARIGEGGLKQMDVTIVEIPAGGQLALHRHLAEEMAYIISGQGYTAIWNQANGKKEKYIWKEGDYLSPTLNSWHQYFNTSTSLPSRILLITSAPLIKNLFKSEALLTSVDYSFQERWEKSVAQKPEYFGNVEEGADAVRMKVGQLLPDLPGRAMDERRKGVLGITITPEGDMAQNHIMEMEVREYLNSEENSPGHRHVWETVYFIVGGDGFAMLQRKDESERRLNWKAGDLFVVEANEYHLHRARSGGTARVVQVKASGYFHGVGLADDYLMQPGGWAPDKK
ncbi:MAG: cupin domain-containing protein [Acidobacteria bacterium]|nr:cupin domain-containing protein [Acidobacteriota bacterium]